MKARKRRKIIEGLRVAMRSEMLGGKNWRWVHRRGGTGGRNKGTGGGVRRECLKKVQ